MALSSNFDKTNISHFSRGRKLGGRCEGFWDRKGVETHSLTYTGGRLSKRIITNKSLPLTRRLRRKLRISADSSLIRQK